MQATSKSAVYKSSKSLKQRIYEHRWFYLMFLPIVIFAGIFYYAPMVGIRYSFYDYKAIKEPVFIGLKHFEKMFNLPGFWAAFRNTLYISIGKLMLNTFMAVILSIMLNEIVSIKFKKNITNHYLLTTLFVMGSNILSVRNDSSTNATRAC